MNAHSDFLKFEAVLAHCHMMAPKQNYECAMEYGRKMEYFDSRNKLSLSGQLLAEFIALD